MRQCESRRERRRSSEEYTTRNGIYIGDENSQQKISTWKLCGNSRGNPRINLEPVHVELYVNFHVEICVNIPVNLL